MKCGRCDSKAIWHITDIHGGVPLTSNLCQEHGYEDGLGSRPTLFCLRRQAAMESIAVLPDDSVMRTADWFESAKVHWRCFQCGQAVDDPHFFS